jgi:8-amino-7-oxononanoate synthase/acyl carrier protein
MTECGIIAFEPGTVFKKRIDGTTGPLMHGFTSKIVDSVGKEADTGELLLKGTSMHIGRMQNGGMIPSDVDDDGWLHTGDIARFVNGSLVIEGRVKEIILNESGENIYPDELEDYFDDLLNFVKRYCILGLNDNGNEKIAIVVEVQDNANNEKGFKDISRKVNDANEQLPFLKRIKLIYAAKEPMPLANGMKVRRQKLKEMLENGLFPVTEIQVNVSPPQTPPMTANIKPAVEAGRIEPESDDRFLHIREQVLECFAEVLDTMSDKIGVDMRFVEDLGGDSLDSLELLAMAEARFGVLIEESDYFRCRTVNDVSRLLYEKITGSSPQPHSGAQAYSHPWKAAERRIQDVKSITRFVDSPEYKSFETRFESLKNSKNPYYIPHDSALLDTSIVKGKEVINFGSYNYLGLSGHPQVSRAAVEAIGKLGTSASGSRLLAGEKTLHQELEKEFAEWKHTEAAMVLVGGHSTNVTFVGNFCNDKDLILYDVLSHNSIAQGIKLSHATSRLFPHNDYKAARAILTALRSKFEKVLLIIEGVYSMDGDIAPVPEFVKLKKEFGLFLMVDEAHSSCVIGKNGEGVGEYFNLNPDDIDIKMGTLSKGLGTCGGYLAGKKELIEYLRYTLPGFIFSVGLSPALAAATLEAIRIIRKDNSLVRQLQENIRYFVSKAKEKGFNLCKAGESAVAPVLVGKDSDAFDLSQALFEKGIFVPPAVYPAVPINMARLRFCLTSCHNKNQIDNALDILPELAGKMKIVLQV